MKKNMGATDRLIRIIIAAAVIALYFLNIFAGTLGIILLIIAGIFILTSIFGFCPLYTLFGISTCSKEKNK